ncbi:hypothetical protein M885DRAFT_514888, partial [Pelagophyceae sp. CCMP2097]
MRTLLCLFAAAFVVPTLSATATVRKVAMQRRRIVAAVILADSRAPRRSWKNRWSQRLDWPEHVRSFTMAEFRTTYRVSHKLFCKILEDLRPELETLDERQARNAPTGAIAAEVRLAVALRWLAGGNVNDIYRLHHISKSEMYKSLWRVVDAINAKYTFSFPKDDDIEALQDLERGFRAKSTNQIFEGCVGAVDGLLVKIRQPWFWEDRNLRRFFCARKNMFCLNVQAVCDAARRFTFADIHMPGSSADSRIPRHVARPAGAGADARGRLLPRRRRGLHAGELASHAHRRHAGLHGHRRRQLQLPPLPAPHQHRVRLRHPRPPVGRPLAPSRVLLLQDAARRALLHA